MNPVAMLMPDPHAPLMAQLEWMVKTSGEKIVVNKTVLEVAKKRIGKKWCDKHLVENKLLSTEITEPK